MNFHCKRALFPEHVFFAAPCAQSSECYFRPVQIDQEITAQTVLNRSQSPWSAYVVSAFSVLYICARSSLSLSLSRRCGVSGDKIRNPHRAAGEWETNSHLTRAVLLPWVYFDSMQSLVFVGCTNTFVYMCVVCGRLFWSPSEILSVELRGTGREKEHSCKSASLITKRWRVRDVRE